VTTRQQNQRLSEIAGKPTFRSIDAVSVRFAESDSRNSDARLLSPWPESHLAYEPTWSRLAGTSHLVAIDLPGFGRSERKDTLMSPRAMGDFMVRAADAFGLKHPHNRRAGRWHSRRPVRRGRPTRSLPQPRCWNEPVWSVRRFERPSRPSRGHKGEPHHERHRGPIYDVLVNDPPRYRRAPL
jgi:hypothetical protein